MKTYRAYVLDTTSPLAPVAHVVYVQSVKYDGAWKAGRAALDADKRGKPVAGYPAEKATLFTDAACKTPFAHFGKAYTFVRCDDTTARNVKLDVAALAALLADESKPAEERIAAAAQMATLAATKK